MSRLLLVRHGQTDANSRERFWGKTNVELSEAGIRQAEKLRDRLAGQRIDAVYSSGLKRALVTAGIIASPHHLECVACAELNEIDFGQFEGLTFGEIAKLYPDIAAQMVNWSIRPRFPGGESPHELSARVNKFLPRLAKHGEEETIVIVAHSGTLRLLICNLLGLEMRHWRQMRLDLASLSIVETYTRGAILALLNDVSHLGDSSV